MYKIEEIDLSLYLKDERESEFLNDILVHDHKLVTRIMFFNNNNKGFYHGYDYMNRTVAVIMIISIEHNNDYYGNQHC